LGKKPRNTGFILTIHDLIFFRYPRYYKALDRWFYKIKSRYAVQKADHIIAISEQTRKDIVEFLKVDPGKITVIYQDCDPSFYKKIAPSDLEFIRENYSLPKKYILYVGTLEPRKRSLELIKAFHILKRDYLSTIELVLVGKKTDYFMELLSYIRENQLDRCIHFYHDISILDLPGFYQMAELFIYPSTFEGFGLPILEALVSGVPVITSQGSCFSEAGGEGSIYLNPENSAYFAETIHEILNNKSLQNKMKLKGLEHSRKFEAKGLANQLMEVYKSTIN
jgi:glycosyltransferase involved in cell wall biosynthesis